MSHLDHPHSGHSPHARPLRFLVGSALLALFIGVVCYKAGDPIIARQESKRASALTVYAPEQQAHRAARTLNPKALPIQHTLSPLELLHQRLEACEKIDDLLPLLDAGMMPGAMSLAVQAGLYLPEGEELTKLLMRRWGELDADAAVRYAVNISGDWGAPAAIHVLATATELRSEWAELAREFPAYYAADFLSALWDGLTGEITHEWRGWVEALPTGQLREAATEALAGHWVQHAPQEAAAWLLTQDSNGHLSQAYRRLAEQWSSSDPQAAFHWTKSLQPTVGQSYAQKAILTSWAQRDPHAAFQHILTQSTSPAANDYRYWYVQAAAKAVPLLADQMRKQITDPMMRAEVDSLLREQNPSITPLKNFRITPP